MNEELKNLANETLIELLNHAIQVKDFVVDQTPMVIQELLMWNFACSLIRFTLPIVFIIGLLIAIKKYKLFSRAVNAPHDDLPLTLCTLALVILTAIPLVNWTWLKIMIAPKVWLIEYAAQLVN